MDACEHLRAVVNELERRGLRRLNSWMPHRNDLVFTTFLAPGVDGRELRALFPETLRVGNYTGCYRADHTHVWCECRAGAYCVVLLAEREET